MRASLDRNAELQHKIRNIVLNCDKFQIFWNIYGKYYINEALEADLSQCRTSVPIRILKF